LDQELAELASTAAITVVKAIATDGWEAAKARIGALWRRAYPQSADIMTTELANTRAEVLSAREANDEETELEITGDWRGKFRRLLVSHPGLADELRQLVQEQQPLQQAPTTTMTAFTSGHGRTYQSAGDMHISDQRGTPSG
jgi:hypothetical protein